MAIKAWMDAADPDPALQMADQLADQQSPHQSGTEFFIPDFCQKQ